MQSGLSLERLVNFYQTTRRHISKDSVSFRQTLSCLHFLS